MDNNNNQESIKHRLVLSVLESFLYRYNKLDTKCIDNGIVDEFIQSLQRYHQRDLNRENSLDSIIKDIILFIETQTPLMLPILSEIDTIIKDITNNYSMLYVALNLFGNPQKNQLPLILEGLKNIRTLVTNDMTSIRDQLTVIQTMSIPQ